MINCYHNLVYQLRWYVKRPPSRVPKLTFRALALRLSLWLRPDARNVSDRKFINLINQIILSYLPPLSTPVCPPPPLAPSPVCPPPPFAPQSIQHHSFSRKVPHHKRLGYFIWLQYMCSHFSQTYDFVDINHSCHILLQKPEWCKELHWRWSQKKQFRC